MDIERFLWRCAQVPALALSDPFTAFVSKAQGFDEAKKELDKQIDSRGVEEMIRAYKQLFPSQMSYVLGSTATVDAELGGLLEWLAAAESKMQTVTNNHRALCSADGAVSVHLSFFLLLCCVVMVLVNGSVRSF
jgi:hypothetical protein